MSRALLIVDHGSRRADAHAHLEWLAERVRERRPDLPVYVAHMELAEPSIAAAVERCAADGVTDLLVHPLFLVPGRHLTEDVPALLDSAASLHANLRVHITPALGTEPSLADAIVATLPSEPTD